MQNLYNYVRHHHVYTFSRPNVTPRDEIFRYYPFRICILETIKYWKQNMEVVKACKRGCIFPFGYI